MAHSYQNAYGPYGRLRERAEEDDCPLPRLCSVKVKIFVRPLAEDGGVRIGRDRRAGICTDSAHYTFLAILSYYF